MQGDINYKRNEREREHRKGTQNKERSKTVS